MLRSQMVAMNQPVGNPFAEYIANDEDIDAACPPEMLLNADADDDELQKNGFL